MDQNPQVPVVEQNQFTAHGSPKKKTKTIVLVIIAILLVAGFAAGGWWYGTSQVQKESDAKVEKLNSKIAELQKESNALQQGESTNKKDSDALVIKEWNVEITQPSGTEISYQISSQDANSADFVSSEQKALGGTCGTFASARYHIFRAPAGYKATDDIFANQLLQAQKDGLSMKVGTTTYYIIGDASGGDCTGKLKEGESVSQTEIAANQNLLNALKTVKSSN